MKKEDTLILGAGPAGMSCAMELHNAGKKSVVIEKDDKIGGLAKTLIFKEGEYTFRTDIGPHRFFSKNEYLYDFIKKLLGEKWIVVKRQTRQYIDGKFYDYPINAGQAFKNIGLWRTLLMSVSYARAIIVYRVFKKEIKSFDDYIVSNFGRRLGEFSMLNYTEKIWGIDCKKIHPDWAKQRIKGLNLVSVLANAVFKKRGKNSPKTLIDSFYYPKYGTGLIYETIATKIEESGGQIKTKSFPTKIFHKENKINSVELSIDGQESVIEPEQVVSSIPITEFVKLLNPQPPKEIFDAVNKLQWRAQVYLFMTIDKERVTDDDWIYFPDRDIPIGRVAEMKNFSKDMSPFSKTSLFVEFFVTEGDEIWNMDKEKIFNIAMRYFEKLDFFSRSDVRDYYMFKKKHVYPVYDIDYPKHLKIIKDYLDQFQNLFYIGRPGRFQYTNQDHSLEMGILAARSIIENKRYNLDDIGSEKEYFEKGYIKSENYGLKNKFRNQKESLN